MSCLAGRWLLCSRTQADGSAFVCTHHGTFHCDEAMACGMLRMLPEFADMPVVRTRDPAVIDAAYVVVDVGGTSDAEARRFDHHQREFTEPFRPAPEGGATKPEDEPVRMSSAGLVYRQYGRDVIAAITGGSLPADSAEQVYQKVYERLIREVDAVDNGVEPFDGPARYRIRTGLGGRVGRLNASWNEDGGAEVENTRFKQAVSWARLLSCRGTPASCHSRCKCRPLAPLHGAVLPNQLSSPHPRSIPPSLRHSVARRCSSPALSWFTWSPRWWTRGCPRATS